MINDTLTFVGRRFVIDNADRSILLVLYLITTVWFLGAFVAKPGRYFIPLSLGVVSLLVAFLVVEPFLYAALIIELASLICVPLLSPPGEKIGRGTLRFLTFISLGTPFILLAGWALAKLELNLNDSVISMQALIFMALGFSFLLAIFPFNTWIPMLFQETHPYAAGFVLCLIPGMVSLFGIGFIERYPWLYSSDVIFGLIRFMGAVMVFSGGLWAAFQNHLGRMFGYALIIDIGMVFFLIGSNQAIFLARETPTLLMPLYLASFISRGLLSAIGALSLSTLRARTNLLTFEAIRGFGRQLPITGAVLIVVIFAFAGYPLLAGFSIRQTVWNQIALISPEFILWSLTGFIGLMIGGLRSLFVITSFVGDGKFSVNETILERVFLLLSIVLIFFTGVFP